MKRLLSLILIFAILLCSSTLASCQLIKRLFPGYVPQQIQPSEGLKFAEHVGGYMLVGMGECTDIDVVIPSTYNGLPVTAISMSAFFMNEDIESVIIPESVIDIADGAFTGCTSLRRVQIPSSFNEHLTQLFIYCRSLEEISVNDENDVYSTDEHGALYATKDNQKILLTYPMGSNLKEFTVPSDVTVIYNSAFSYLPWELKDALNAYTPYDLEDKYFSSLEKVTISEGVEYIGYSAFTACNSLKEVVIPKSIKQIESNAFIFCTNLESIYYNGTIAEWENLDLPEDWYVDIATTVIHCADGDICNHYFGGGIWQIVKQPTFEEEGLMTRSCANCGKVEEKIIEKLKETVTVWVGMTFGENVLIEELIDAFVYENPEYKKYNFEVKQVSVGDVPYNIINNKSSSPDLYHFSSRNIDILMKNGVLEAPSYSTQLILSESNTSNSISAATFEGDIYAYPVKITNGYYMYYDKSIITNPDSLEQIIEDVEKSGRMISFDLENAWYLSSFFFGAGCMSEWVYDENGNVMGLEDTFNSDNGLIAMKGLSLLAKSSAPNDGKAAVIITGSWDRYTAETELGANLAATDLPSFTVNGASYHLGSYAEYEYIGVKPTENKQKAEMLEKLALYLSGETRQSLSYYESNFVPTNLAVADEIKTDDAHTSALIEQSEYAIAEKIIPNGWWNIANKLTDAARNATSDNDLLSALEEYEKEVNELLNK